jgi:glycine/D-amino acid oxidase-like deaminating enzyme
VRGTIGVPMPEATPVTALPPGARVAIFGAGIVGACVALQLRRAGFATCLLDAMPPGHGASSGNAGLISVDSCIPLALPGLMRQVPKWLLDPSGPLVLRASAGPRAVPWLWQRVRGCAMANVLRTSDAMAALHRDALQLYRELLGSAFDASIRGAGQLHVWTQPASPAHRTDIEARLRERQGVEARWLTRAELQALVPGIAPAFQRALHFPRNAHSLDPLGLVHALVQAHEQAGGALQAEHALALRPEGSGWRVVTAAGEQAFDAVVIANGLAARDLMRPLGLKLPLLAERGYHLHITGCLDMPALPVVYRDKGVVATPMADGLRLAGTVEIAREDAPPDERRARLMLEHARTLFPDFDLSGRARTWMGSRPSTPDGLPIIDAPASHPGLVLACGHSHFGLTGAPMTGRLVADLLSGKTPPIGLAAYRLSRFH